MTPEQRIQAFRAFVARSPDDAFARYSLAMALRSAGQGGEAASEFEEPWEGRVRHPPSG